MEKKEKVYVLGGCLLGFLVLVNIMLTGLIVNSLVGFRAEYSKNAQFFKDAVGGFSGNKD